MFGFQFTSVQSFVGQIESDLGLFLLGTYGLNYEKSQTGPGQFQETLTAYFDLDPGAATFSSTSTTTPASSITNTVGPGIPPIPPNETLVDESTDFSTDPLDVIPRAVLDETFGFRRPVIFGM